MLRRVILSLELSAALCFLLVRLTLAIDPIHISTKSRVDFVFK